MEGQQKETRYPGWHKDTTGRDCEVENIMRFLNWLWLGLRQKLVIVNKYFIYQYFYHYKVNVCVILTHVWLYCIWLMWKCIVYDTLQCLSKYFCFWVPPFGRKMSYFVLKMHEFWHMSFYDYLNKNIFQVKILIKKLLSQFLWNFKTKWLI